MSDRGFTLVEVLFALSITAIMAMVIGGSVVLSLRTEAQGQQWQTRSLDVTTLQTRLILSPSSPNPPAGWLQVDALEEEQGDVPRRWLIYAPAVSAQGQRMAFSFMPAVSPDGWPASPARSP